MSTPPFVEKLLKASRSRDSLLCIGLDPDPSLMPDVDVATFNREIVAATCDLVCAYKPNLAFYEALGIDGLTALKKTLAHIPGDIPVIGDAKRGDVENSAAAYARAMFEFWGFDAVTVHPYIGEDSIEPFARYADRGVFVLCRTSNPGKNDFQGLPVRSLNALRPMYQLVAVKVKSWDSRGNLGLVVGATHPEDLREVRSLCPETPILVPGVGAQGGDLAAAVRNGADRNGERVIISSSRQVLYASRGKDFAEAARKVALSLRAQMREALAAARQAQQ